MDWTEALSSDVDIYWKLLHNNVLISDRVSKTDCNTCCRFCPRTAHRALEMRGECSMNSSLMCSVRDIVTEQRSVEMFETSAGLFSKLYWRNVSDFKYTCEGRITWNRSMFYDINLLSTAWSMFTKCHAAIWRGMYCFKIIITMTFSQ